MVGCMLRWLPKFLKPLCIFLCNVTLVFLKLGMEFISQPMNMGKPRVVGASNPKHQEGL